MPGAVSVMGRSLCGGARVLHGVGGDRRQVDRQAVERPSLVDAGEQQQLVDQDAHALGLLLDAAHGRLEVGGAVFGAAMEELGVAADRGERRAQLVRGVGQEAAQPVLGRLALGEGVLDVLEHAVERQGRAGRPPYARRPARRAATGRRRRWPWRWRPWLRAAAARGARCSRRARPGRRGSTAVMMTSPRSSLAKRLLCLGERHGDDEMVSSVGDRLDEHAVVAATSLPVAPVEMSTEVLSLGGGRKLGRQPRRRHGRLRVAEADACRRRRCGGREARRTCRAEAATGPVRRDRQHRPRSPGAAGARSRPGRARRAPAGRHASTGTSAARSRSPTPARTSPTATSPTRASSRRRRSDTFLVLARAQAVAHAADRLDERGTERIELASQIPHVGLDDVAVAAEVVVPDVIEDLALGDDAASVEQKVAQQLELGRGELDQASGRARPRGCLRPSRDRRTRGGRRRRRRRRRGAGWRGCGPPAPRC